MNSRTSRYVDGGSAASAAERSFEPLVRGVRSSKIQERHLDRLAIVYVRQSSAKLIVEHPESRERQYDLAAHAVALGWAPNQVIVIDEDQGCSGRTSDKRTGFQRLLAEVTLDHVGVILGLEMSNVRVSESTGFGNKGWNEPGMMLSTQNGSTRPSIPTIDWWPGHLKNAGRNLCRSYGGWKQITIASLPPNRHSCHPRSAQITALSQDIPKL